MQPVRLHLHWSCYMHMLTHKKKLSHKAFFIPSSDVWIQGGTFLTVRSTCSNFQQRACHTCLSLSLDSRWAFWNLKNRVKTSHFLPNIAVFCKMFLEKHCHPMINKKQNIVRTLYLTIAHPLKPGRRRRRGQRQHKDRDKSRVHNCTSSESRTNFGLVSRQSAFL